MGNRTQQICPHDFFFRLGFEGLLDFDLGGQGTGYYRNDQHNDGGNQVFKGQKVKSKERKSKREVIHQHRKQ